MPAPSNRVPVRIARGTKANLDTNLASLREGEICYAKDEDIIYVVESGVLIPAGGGVSTAGGLDRGDGGNFQTMTVEADFVTNILGGGDFENTSIDQPVENYGMRDGGLFV